MKKPRKNRIFEMRKAKGLTQGRLGELIGTEKSQISKLESGERTLTEDWLRRLSSALGCGIADLIIAPGEGASGLQADAAPPIEDINELKCLRAAWVVFDHALSSGMYWNLSADEKFEKFLWNYNQARSKEGLPPLKAK